MFERGKIILVPFPFTDLSAQKLRPALIVARLPQHSADVIVAFITTRSEPRSAYSVLVHGDEQLMRRTGLKKASRIRCDKLATLDKRIVIGELGSLPPVQMREVSRMLRRILAL